MITSTACASTRSSSSRAPPNVSVCRARRAADSSTLVDIGFPFKNIDADPKIDGRGHYPDAATRAFVVKKHPSIQVALVNSPSKGWCEVFSKSRPHDGEHAVPLTERSEEHTSELQSL